MIKIVILGAGNVASHMIRRFQNVEQIEIIQLYNRTKEKLNEFAHLAPITDSDAEIADADVYIISVSDDYIEEVAQKLVSKKGIVVHTSGSASMERLLPNENIGVFYPLQTFSKDKEIDFSKIPFCLEAKQEVSYKILEVLAKAISNSVFAIDSEQRKILHVAAVFVNNFTNYIYQMGSDICETYDIPFEILIPLIQETSSKIETLHPKEAQTGPAKRNDKTTITNHLKLLNEKQQEIYSLLTKAIQESHGEKL
ncbi:Rossmann-like and DUF2520 domain-containing protein [Aureivirga sp. CE67]|uniref:Rossmann-like and DUF2520 domain-containing protein n=1 Tax=Aureivirga sp. CE67 TaxID=1788983 RepID=UPI0018CBDEA2|nr:Rossmann-like and DUF2520 domain-containing protein [Aureivirga sp. CE67]